MPLPVLAEMRKRREMRKKRARRPACPLGKYRDQLHKQFFTEYDHYLDQNRKIDWLARPAIAAVIRGNLYHHDGDEVSPARVLCHAEPCPRAAATDSSEPPATG